MAVLPEADRADLWAEVQALGLCPGGVTKAQFRAAVDAADTWVDGNSSSYNTALPAAYRNDATPAQKAHLLAIIALRRYSTGV